MDPVTPTAFVSWAHSSGEWDVSQVKQWERTIALLADSLNRFGIMTDVDLYHQHETGGDWNRYGFSAIRESDFVLVAVSRGWLRRFEGTEAASIGAGSSREADVLLDLFNDDRDEFRRKVILLFLPETDTEDIPVTLGGLRRFRIGGFSANGLDDLLRTLHGKPRYRRPLVGPPPSFESETLDRPSLTFREKSDASLGEKSNLRHRTDAVDIPQSEPRATPSPSPTSIQSVDRDRPISPIRRWAHIVSRFHLAKSTHGARILVIDSNQCLLLVGLRMNNRARWDLPGGYVRNGEDPEQCAIRELREESGLDIPADQLEYITLYETPKRLHFEYLFGIHISEGAPFIERSERGGVATYGWFNPWAVPIESLTKPTLEALIKAQACDWLPEYYS